MDPVLSHPACGIHRCEFSPARLRYAAAMLLSALLWLLSPALSAADASEFMAASDGEGVDAVLIIDSSGSMKETDPKRMRVPAARMFISLLGKQDRVGVVSFSDAGYPVAHLTPTTEANRKPLFAAVDKVSALGAYTNLHAALETGRKMLAEEGGEGRRQLLVLMSDGKMDTGDYDQDQALVERIDSDMIAGLNAAGIEVYTLAFTEASDMSLLRRIANGTDGISRLASNDRELHRVFSTLFESAKQPDMLPIAGGEFLVDAAIEEVTVVASKNTAGSEIKLVMPDERVIRPEVAGPAVRWFESDGFDMITIDEPPAGTWRLISDGKDNRAYVVTNMRLEGELGGDEPGVGAELTASAWLEQAGEAITAAEILDHTEFSLQITPPEGEPRQLPLEAAEAASGRYTRAFELTQPGSHRIRLIASSRTFQREKSLFVEVPELPAGAAPPAASESEPEPEPEPAPEPKPEPEPEPAPEAEMPPEPEAPEEAPPAMQEEIIEPAPEETEEDTGGGPGLGMILGLFILLNLVVGSAIGGFLWWRKRRSKSAAKGEDEDEDADEAGEEKPGGA